MRSLGLVPLINVPTKISNESQTLLDNTLTSKPYNPTSDVLTFDFSDHFPVFSILKAVFNYVNRKETKQYGVLNDKTLKLLHDK